jgi:hypothetical protein
MNLELKNSGTDGILRAVSVLFDACTWEEISRNRNGCEATAGQANAKTKSLNQVIL